MQTRCRFHSLSRLLLYVVLGAAVATPVLAIAKRMRGVDSD